MDTSDHVSQLVTSEMLAAAHVVFVFDRRSAYRLRRISGVRSSRVLLLGDLDPEWSGKRAIVDPWGGDDSVFGTTFDRIDRCIEAIMRVLGRLERGAHEGASR